jgi:hypothetical protein
MNRHNCRHRTTQNRVHIRYSVSFSGVVTNKTTSLLTYLEPIWVQMNKHRIAFVYLILCLSVSTSVSIRDYENPIKTQYFYNLDTETQNRASRAYMCARTREFNLSFFSKERIERDFVQVCLAIDRSERVHG